MSYQGYSGYPLAQYGEPDRRPAKVTVLAILAILFGALASLGGMLSLVLVSALDAAEDLDLAFGTLRLLAVWSLLACAAEVVGGVVIALLWQRDSTAWYTRDSRPLLPGQYPGLQYPGQYPGQQP